jgi:ribosomal protein L7Ae-like RNA K-turn-binding protein
LILCEKPLANSYHEAKKIDSICNKRNVPIVINFMRRSLPAFIDLKKVINKNINQNHDVIIKYSGCFKNNGSHFVDLMNFIFGKPKKIIQKSCNQTKNNDFKVNATVKYLNAICSYIPLHSEDVSDHEIQIMNNNQKVLITRAGRCMEIYSTIPDIDFKESNEYSISKNIETDYLKFQSYVYNDLYKLITSDLEFRNLCGIKDAVTNIKFLEKLINE